MSAAEQAWIEETLTPLAERLRVALDSLNVSPDGLELGEIAVEFRRVGERLHKTDAPSRRLDAIRILLRDSSQHFAKAARLKREQSRRWTDEGRSGVKAHECALELVRVLPR